MLALTLSTVSIGSGGAIAAAWQQAGPPPTAESFNVDDPIRVDPDNLPFSQPIEWSTLQLYDVYENLFLDPGDPASRRAMNINTVGEVPASSWFENRIGARALGLDEVATGPNKGDGPVPELFTVVGRPTAGITPKFLVEDVDGQRFVFKFDPISNPQMASAAESICSRIFYAAGYNVAETYLLEIHPDQLRIGEGATFQTVVGETRSITYEDLEQWMSNAPAGADGTYRVLASKYIPGVKVGEFRFHGTRPDDPNDIYPHEHRRELRGYRVFSAWLNHDDSRATNTYDTFVGAPDAGHIRHYLLDFGSCLGSATVGPNKPRGGNEYFIDRGPILKSMATLGLWRRPWLDIEYPDFPSVGNLEAERFDPAAWKPEYPNAAFERMDAADAFWAARIAARFTDEMVRAIVDAAEIADPSAAEYLIETLIRRRDKVVAEWITGTNPLDGLDAAGPPANARLSWENAAVRAGAATPGDGYEVRWSSFDNDAGSEGRATQPRHVASPEIAVPVSAWGAADAMGDRYARARIATLHPAFTHWRRPVVVTLRDRDGEVSVVGVVRPRQTVRRADS